MDRVSRKLPTNPEDAKEVRLPSPPRRPQEKWLPAVRVGRYIPFGYKQDEEDAHLLTPIIEELELLEMAKKLLKEYSLRTVADWLTEKSGRKISHMGLSKRVKLETRRKAHARQQRRYAQLYQEATETAAKIEHRIGGTGIRSHSDHTEAVELRRTQREWDELHGGDPS
jgi:hypothetical protein